MSKIGRRAYAEMFGPTTGDRVRLADTELVIEVERDLTVYGEEVKFAVARPSVTAWDSHNGSTARTLTRPATA